MLDPKTLKVGSIIKLKGTILQHDIKDYPSFNVLLDGGSNNFGRFCVSTELIEKAELVSHPEPKFTKEQVEAIQNAYEKRFKIGGIRNDSVDFFEWLDEHTEK